MTRTSTAQTAESTEPLVDAVVQTAFVTMAVLNRIGAEHDLSLTQLRVLAILRDRRLRMAELAAYLGLERSTMSGLVDRAEKRGLLERAAGPGDGRAVEVTLSPVGSELADRLTAQVSEALADRLARLDDASQHALSTLLRRLLGPDPARPAMT